MTADQIMNTIPCVGVATSSRIGNLLGSRNAKGAVHSAHSSAILARFLAILISTRYHFAKISDNDTQFVELVADIILLVALFQIADGTNGSCGGILRGTRRQNLGATVDICVALYCAGILEWVLIACSDWECTKTPSAWTLSTFWKLVLGSKSETRSDMTGLFLFLQ
ncbi:transporter [Penicillium taxi]|uniref:transporter n=1 Tax=Penicillium taxi TaxID=168475 RepID=UPI0025452B44|nr:transporter [Penicillium taxi]KAJ5894948.1 transporter [Penicillium taxi]